MAQRHLIRAELIAQLAPPDGGDIPNAQANYDEAAEPRERSKADVTPVPAT